MSDIETFIKTRLYAELSIFLESAKTSNFEFAEDSMDDIFIWTVKIFGLPQTLAEGHEFYIKFEFYDGWPELPPKVWILYGKYREFRIFWHSKTLRFKTKIF